MRKNEKITALYERLSRDDFGKDDDQQRESNSISNQKAMLEEFAARQGFTNIVHFTDDGISGTCFDRPGFLAMMKEVEAGNVEYLCIKDMSRMGRDYLKVGQIMEILRQRGVRLIAINDGVDSARGDDDFTPFRNIMNEYYARDTSRKIRSTFQSKGKSGKHLTGTVIYGYLWNEARDQWLVDPEAADVVKRIFAMTIDGYGPYQIASKLKEEKVLIPSAYLAQHGEGVNKNKTFKDVYGWGSSTICNILEKREYLGHTINFKTRKHFKDKKSHYVPEDEWTIFENTHEAIIDQQTFDLVQKIRGNVRRYPDGWGEAAPLTGLLYCADCGGKMYRFPCTVALCCFATGLRRFGPLPPLPGRAFRQLSSTSVGQFGHPFSSAYQLIRAFFPSIRRTGICSVLPANNLLFPGPRRLSGLQPRRFHHGLGNTGGIRCFRLSSSRLLFDLFHPYQLLLSSCHSSDFQIGKSKSPLASGGCLCYHKGKL